MAAPPPRAQGERGRKKLPCGDIEKCSTPLGLPNGEVCRHLVGFAIFLDVSKMMFSRPQCKGGGGPGNLCTACCNATRTLLLAVLSDKNIAPSIYLSLVCYILPA